MTSLSKSAFDRAAEFIQTQARLLERVQFEYHFESGPVSAVLEELEKYQTSDGGFGHGIEPDLRMPFSSPFSSSVAFQILTEVEVPASNQMVQAGIAYLRQSFDGSLGGWDPTGPLVNQSPHALCWNYTPVDNELDAIKRSNPGAELLGYLLLYENYVDEQFIRKVTESVLRTFDELPDDMEIHSMLCFMRLLESAPSDLIDNLLPKLKRGVRLVIGKSVNDWKAYGARPLWFASKPTSLLAKTLADLIPVQLDYEIESQSETGSWRPNWTWGQYEDGWEEARLEWSGYLTLRNLMAVKAWGRISFQI
ncbi:MAG: hypothetical protein HQ477_11675 [Chloroflexi bacterium]|nr:hypothetical protein [Chloroflexota bacterium]